ncbi:YlbD family protein [Sediminibacillus massiliensis]|uniref:YlbD family protein n=1 Tax=Sediminibacillus massiliensis TaxID=1926277 RepID=UPI0009888BFA|nr:YlbD family protein [Sediminibacillus massiliensis]
MKDVHPTVKEFKEFVKRHPLLIKEVKENHGNWQDYYEKWVLLGEEDDTWNRYRTDATSDSQAGKTDKETKKDKQQELTGQFMKMIENVDLNKVQHHIHQLNGAISNIQTLVGQFQEIKRQGNIGTKKSQPFNWSKD